MAPQQLTEEDYSFLVCCIKHTPAKPDFDVVAKDFGMKNKKQAYKRHYDLMKKIGASTVASNNGNNGDTPGSGAKRGRPSKKEKEAMVIAGVGEDSEPETPSKKPKKEESDDD